MTLGRDLVPQAIALKKKKLKVWQKTQRRKGRRLKMQKKVLLPLREHDEEKTSQVLIFLFEFLDDIP